MIGEISIIRNFRKDGKFSTDTECDCCWGKTSNYAIIGDKYVCKKCLDKHMEILSEDRLCDFGERPPYEATEIYSMLIKQAKNE